MIRISGNRGWRLVVALFAAMALIAAACGSDDNGADEAVDTENDSSTAEAAEVEEEPAEAEEEPAESEPEEAGPIDVTIGIVNIAPVAALELVHEGFVAGLQECAAEVNATVDYRNAEGDGSQLAPIVAEFLDSDVDLILAISTPVLQATVAANEADGRGIPVLFGAVTDPFAAGAAAGPDDKPDWLTGWQADAPVSGMFDIAQAINPEGAVVGVAFDPSQVNAEIAVGKMEAEAETRGMTVETATIGDSSEVGTAATALAGRGVDFFFVPTDSILVNGLAGMVQVADDFDIPMIAQDSNIVRAGASVGTGLDYLGDGGRNAEYACEILQGNATPADFSIQQFPDELVAFSSTSAADQGFEVPESVASAGQDFG